MRIYFPNLGKSDCIMIEFDHGRFMMIDTSFTENGPYICDFLKTHQIEQIDYLILTHLDKDHIGGAPEILRTIPVVSIVQPDYTVNTPQYKAYVEALIELDKTPFFLLYDVTLEIDHTRVKLLAAKKPHYEKSNDYSILIEMFENKLSFLFMADAENVRINEFIKENHRIYDVVKMPHHGILVPATEDLIESTNPVNAIITCANKQTNIDETISLLEQHGSNIYLTREGSVFITTREDHLQIMQFITSE